MATIAENLSNLQQTKNDIKSAIERRGQDLTYVPFTQYAKKIMDIGSNNEEQSSYNIIYTDTQNNSETISSTLAQLQQVKNDIKTAIESRGQDLTNIPFTEYANKIMDIVVEEEPVGTKGLVYIGLNSSGEVETDETEIVSYMIGDGSQNGSGYTGTDTEVVIPETYNGLPITKIAEYAFRYITHVTNIYIPSSVTTIGTSAFESCTALTEISLPEGLTIIETSEFENCISLTIVNLPESLTTIYDDAFHGCNLKSITIPANVTSIGDGAFNSCSNLTEITLNPTTPPTLNSTSSISTATTVIYVPVQSLMAYKTATNWNEFADIMVGFGEQQGTEGLVYTGLDESGAVTTEETAIVSYMIGNNTTTAGNGYAGTDTDIIIPSVYNGKPVTQIGQYSFRNLTTLTSVLIPDSVTTIGRNAFQGCTGLTEIDIPNGVTAILNSVFNDCKNLKSITIPSGVISIGNQAFYRCSSLVEIKIPSAVTSIGNNAFQGCTGLTEIDLPKGITTIGRSLIYGCTGITSVEIPEGVMSIEHSAFRNTGLTEITIPSSVMSIETYAFSDCSNLTKMTLLPTMPPTLTNKNAISTATTTIRVPQLSLETYKTATNWSEFASIMTGF